MWFEFSERNTIFGEMIKQDTSARKYMPTCSLGFKAFTAVRMTRSLAPCRPVGIYVRVYTAPECRSSSSTRGFSCCNGLDVL